MSVPTELSFDEILKFMLAHNGKVTNYELVKHFKVFLMNPDMRDEARNTFKKHVNSLAIIKNQNNEKWLILKKKYMPNNSKKEENDVDVNESGAEVENSSQAEKYQPPPPLQLNQDFSILANLIQDNNAASVIDIPPASPALPQSESSNSLTLSSDAPPKVPRRKSADKVAEKCSSLLIAPLERALSTPNDDVPVSEPAPLAASSVSKSEGMLIDSEQKISVKERKQMFNRMASEGDMLKSNQISGNLSAQSIDEEDRVSLDPKSESDPLDSKQKQWILCAARGEYHALAKMCKENSKLVKTKDPFTYTAMHWACKRGDENLVKLLAGVARQVVYERSVEYSSNFNIKWLDIAAGGDVKEAGASSCVACDSNGYTPLHIAMQFRHENLYRLLVEAYDADPNTRDWSGRKPRQYLVHMDTSMSPGSYRKTETFELKRAVNSPPTLRVTPVHTPSKKEGFLRIGSLNVRVKKTTEAFSNFLGVGATRSSAYIPKSARERQLERRSDEGELHKTWGSADNIQKDDKLMPPPTNSSKVRRRGANGRRGLAAHSRSTPTTPDQPRARIGSSETGDSDSDSAAGFHSAWRQQRASNCT